MDARMFLPIANITYVSNFIVLAVPSSIFNRYLCIPCFVAKPSNFLFGRLTVNIPEYLMAREVVPSPSYHLTMAPNDWPYERPRNCANCQGQHIDSNPSHIYPDCTFLRDHAENFGTVGFYNQNLRKDARYCPNYGLNHIDHEHAHTWPDCMTK